MRIDTIKEDKNSRARVERVCVQNGILPVLALLFVSGMCALAFEMLWVRMLSLIFGNTLYAVSTVLATFMAGLALGSASFGRVADKTARPLRLYAVLELCTGAYCLLTPFLLGGVEWAFLAAASGESSRVFAGALRFGLGAAVLLPPTVLMGGTLPVLTRYFSSCGRQTREIVGRLYSANTLGAVAGVCLTGFGLIMVLGVVGTLVAFALLNIAVGAVAYHLSRSETVREGGSLEASGRERGPSELALVSGARTILAVFALSGFTALIFEVAWTRALSLILGSSVYAFAIILAAFLAGIALGGIAFVRLFRNRADLTFLFGAIQAAIGCVVLGMNLLFPDLPFVFLKMFRLAGSNFAVYEAFQLLLVGGLLLVPTVLFGMTFPLVIELLGHKHGVGATVGRAYAFNTWGAVVGSLSAGFVLIPALGTQNTIAAAALLSAGAGVLLLYRVGRSKYAVGVAAAALTLAVIAPRWQPQVMAHGAFDYASSFGAERMQKFGWSEWSLWKASLQKDELIFFKEGLHASVMVKKNNRPGAAAHVLYVGGKADASSNSWDMATQVLMGHIPMLLYPKSQTALVVGLGSGATLAAVEKYGVGSIDLVEIEPAVAEASRFFDSFTGAPLEDPRVNVVFDDARHQLLTSRKTYDTIILGPSNPWTVGSSALFSRDFYETVESRMSEGGIVCQWGQFYSLSPDAFRSIVATFRSVFPHATLWRPNGDSGDVLMIAAKTPIRLDYDRLREAMSAPGVREDLAKVGVKTPEDLLAKFASGSKVLGVTAGKRPLHTDDRPLLEFEAPKFIHDLNSARKTQELLVASAESVLDHLSGVPSAELLAGAYDREGLFRLAVEIREKNSAFNQGSALAKMDQIVSLMHLGSNARALALLNSGLGSEAKLEATVGLLVDALSHGGREALITLRVGQIFAVLGEKRRAASYFGEAISKDPSIMTELQSGIGGVR